MFTSSKIKTVISNRQSVSDGKQIQKSSRLEGKKARKDRNHKGAEEN